MLLCSKAAQATTAAASRCHHDPEWLAMLLCSEAAQATSAAATATATMGR